MEAGRPVALPSDSARRLRRWYVSSLIFNFRGKARSPLRVMSVLSLWSAAAQDVCTFCVWVQDDFHGLVLESLALFHETRVRIERPEDAFFTLGDPGASFEVLDGQSDGVVPDRFRFHAAFDLVEAQRFVGRAQDALDLVHGGQGGPTCVKSGGLGQVHGILDTLVVYV